MSGAYVYIQSEKAGSWRNGRGEVERWGDLWTVGHYDPDGKFIPESDHKSAADAAARVAYLNGGQS